MSRDITLLEDDFQQQVLELLARCSDAGVEMRVYFTLRDPATQARLWRQSRSTEEITARISDLRGQGAEFLAHVIESVGPQFGDPVTNAIPGLSWHQWGEAVDCFWLLEGRAEWSTRKTVDLPDGRRVNGYRLFGETAREVGLTSGGFWTSLRDWPHIQKRPAGVRRFFSVREIDREMQARFG